MATTKKNTIKKAEKEEPGKSKRRKSRWGGSGEGSASSGSRGGGGGHGTVSGGNGGSNGGR